MKTDLIDLIDTLKKDSPYTDSGVPDITETNTYQQFLGQDKDRLTECLPLLFDIIDDNILQNLFKEGDAYSQTCEDTASLAWLLSQAIIRKLIDTRTPLSETLLATLLARHQKFMQSLEPHFTKQLIADYAGIVTNELFIEIPVVRVDPDDGDRYKSSAYLNIGYFPDLRRITSKLTVDSLLAQLFDRMNACYTPIYAYQDMDNFPVLTFISTLKKPQQKQLIQECVTFYEEMVQLPSTDRLEDIRNWLWQIVTVLIRKNLNYTEDEVYALFSVLADIEHHHMNVMELGRENQVNFPLHYSIKQIEHLLKSCLKNNTTLSPKTAQLFSHLSDSSLILQMPLMRENQSSINRAKDKLKRMVADIAIQTQTASTEETLSTDLSAEKLATSKKQSAQAQKKPKQSQIAINLFDEECLGETINHYISQLTFNTDERNHWIALIRHCDALKGTTPSKKWQKDAQALKQNLDSTDADTMLIGLINAVTKQALLTPKDAYFSSRLEQFFRGVLWALADVFDTSKDNTNNAHAEKCQSSIIGLLRVTYNYIAFSEKIGNTCIKLLEIAPTITMASQLKNMSLKLEDTKCRNNIIRTVKSMSTILNVSDDTLAEMGVPEFGFKEGALSYTLGDYTLHVHIANSRLVQQWQNPTGKMLKSIPSAIKKDAGLKATYDELKAEFKQIQQFYSIQKLRLDSYFALERTWTGKDFESYYIQHAFVGLLARKLIWNIHTGDQRITALYVDNQWQDIEGNVLPQFSDGLANLPNCTVTLWHPVLCDESEIVVWRERIMALELTQPIKQAFREIYLLTDAERHTELYSNRMASHILKQHQFKALAKLRHWEYSLSGYFSHDQEDCIRKLPQYGLQAEFWVEDMYTDEDHDMNASANYYISTDQVRFTKLIDADSDEDYDSYDDDLDEDLDDDIDEYEEWDDETYQAHLDQQNQQFIAERDNNTVPLAEIPKVVFSEIMRDVDLFVGVCSIGNDPEWADNNGNRQEYQDYWRAYSFGELSQVAHTRKFVLEKLLPRLKKIRDVTRIEGKYLIVKGKLRTYKIHIGSSNILMEPNDQYLCIVPARNAGKATDKLFIPFEGDKGLSIVLSKAFLLADDDKITDTTITSQIQH